jgi:hypothetical protein
MAQNHVASGLVVKLVSDGNKRLPRNAGQSAQTFTSTISSLIDGGIGSPCFFRLSSRT